MKILGIACALVLAAGLKADVLYDSLTTSSGIGLPIGGGTSGTVTIGTTLYDSFSTGNVAETLTSLIVGLAPTLIFADPITATLYLDNGSTAGAPIQLTGGAVIGTLDDSVVSLGGTGDYAINLTSNPLLAANTRYWIALSGIDTVNWLVSTSSNGIGVANELSDVGGSTVTANSTIAPFQMEVQAAAPEPANPVPLMGLVALGLLRFRRRS